MNRIIFILIFLSLTSFSKKEETKFVPIFNDEKKKKISYIYELRNKTGKEIIDAVSLDKNLVIKEFENKLIIKGYKDDVDEIVDIIKGLDTTKSQVFVKVKILDINKGLIERLGLNWSKDSDKSLIDFLNSDYENKLKKYKDNGDIVLKIMPSLLILDGTKSSMKISSLTLKLTPNIKKKQFRKYVELDLELNFSNKEYIKTVINIDDKKTKLISSNKLFENSSFSYLSSKNVKREVYIEIEVIIQ